MTVTFFGNRDASVDIKPKLRKTIIQLITEQDADNFYVGNIIKTIGHKDDPGVDILSIVAKYGINDLRLLFENDVRFLKQFYLL